uniref:Translation initiation factor IF-2-like n=1 Tax=Tursiops truncatus TaxID=9739 RepID=A0A6J3RVM6_TURTR|nr:translation initiation factor IF-2-like [Tursiops truncatus]
MQLRIWYWDAQSADLRRQSGRPVGRRGTGGLSQDVGPGPAGRGVAARGGAAGQGGRGAEEVRSSRLGAGPQCRPGSGATTRGPGARGGRGSLRSKSCSAAGNRGGGGTTRSSCSSSSTWSPFMKNLLLDLSRRMRLSQKTVYQMSQAMNMPGNFWPTHQPKDFGCHWGKKSKSCSAHEDPMYDIIRENKRHEKDVRLLSP